METKNTGFGVYSIAEQNPPVPGWMISGQILSGVQVFSLAQGTDISAESYPVPALVYDLEGEIILFDAERKRETAVSSGELMIKATGRTIDIRAEQDSVYLEITLGKENQMKYHSRKERDPEELAVHPELIYNNKAIFRTEYTFF